MSNQLYLAAKEDILSGNLNLASNTITVALVSNTHYTFSSGHTARSDVSNSAIIAYNNLTNQSVTDGVFDADDVTFANVPSGTVTDIILYHNTGDAENNGADQSSSRLLGYIDTAIGFPLTASNTTITVEFSNLANKIFTL